MTATTNHPFIAGYTHDECVSEQGTDDGVCLHSEWHRVHFPPGDDWDQKHSQLMNIISLAMKYWRNNE